MDDLPITFVGVDVDLEISLFEYGIILSEEEHTDGSHTHFAVYMIDEDHFGTSHITEEEINEYGLDKFTPEDVNSFLETMGETSHEWINNSMITKLSDILNYWGYLNVFGTDYNPVDKKYVIKNYLKL